VTMDDASRDSDGTKFHWTLTGTNTIGLGGFCAGPSLANLGALRAEAAALRAGDRLKIFLGRKLGLQEYNDAGGIAIAEWIRNLARNPNQRARNIDYGRGTHLNWAKS